jgi:hypothetical protein
MVESLKDHVLEEIPAGDKIKAFWMRRPGTGFYCTMILFTPVGIVIGGDICLSSDSGGVISHNGHYGLDWFVDEQMSEDYLCSKFLRSTVWEKERAAAWCREQAEEILKGEDAQEGRLRSLAARDFRALATALESGSVERPEELMEELGRLKHECDDGVPGYGYPSAEAGWLCAIQKKFTELYLKTFHGKRVP